jgi:hypothetical protein
METTDIADIAGFLCSRGVPDRPGEGTGAEAGTQALEQGGQDLWAEPAGPAPANAAAAEAGVEDKLRSARYALLPSTIGFFLLLRCACTVMFESSPARHMTGSTQE